LPTAQDHKRAYFKDQGPNTGGMGCISPFVLLDDKKLKEVERTIMKATIDAMRKEDRKFIGVLFAGLMLTTDNQVKVLE
jgi:phosphoribosylamine-glycine ligase